MKFEHTEVWGFEHALRGMRNPMNSWDKSDSNFGICSSNNAVIPFDENNSKDGVVGIYNGMPCYKLDSINGETFFNYIDIGEQDMDLARKLIRAGSEHRKFMRQIFVSVDITAPLYWWKEADTYKVGTTANSTSTMHKLTSQPITMECFETDDYNNSLRVRSGEHYDEDDNGISINAFVAGVVDSLEGIRLKYLETKDKRYWKELIRWLPESWLQTRTITMSYENVFNMVHQRKNHKLNEWSGTDNPELPNFIAWARTLPYAQELIFIDEVVE